MENPKPFIHPSKAVPMHILPLYKAELEKMMAVDIITEVTEPTEWVNSITCIITKTGNGQTKIRLCLDPKDLNKNINRAQYPMRTTDEILPHFITRRNTSVLLTVRQATSMRN